MAWVRQEFDYAQFYRRLQNGKRVNGPFLREAEFRRFFGFAWHWSTLLLRRLAIERSLKTRPICKRAVEALVCLKAAN